MVRLAMLRPKSIWSTVPCVKGERIATAPQARVGRVAAERAIVGARVLTLDPARPSATAVAFRDGRILAVGDDDEIHACSDARTELLDGTGTVLVPGLVDAHAHPLWAAGLARGVDCHSCRTRQDLRRALAGERARSGPGDIVLGWGADYALFDDTGLDGGVLEELAGGPALLTLFDCHTYLATPGVLERAGVRGPERFADNSQIVCRDGVPTGELREFAAYERVSGVLPASSREDALDRIAAHLERMAATGLTAAHVMDGSPDTFALLRELEARGRLPLRLVVSLWCKPAMSDDELAALRRLRDERGTLWRGGVAKLFIDGVVETGTAWLEEPDTRGGGTAAFWPDPARYARVVADFAGDGFQCVTHAVGDRAVRCALDAYAAAGAAPGVRHRVEHGETLPDGHLRRFAAEGVVCSMQPLHMQWRQADGSDEWTRRLGPERSARAWRTRDVVDSGAIVALGSDWPIAHFDPREGMAWARLRRRPGDPDAPVFEPDQVLSGRAALAGYTTGAALATGDEADSGRIAPGARADVTGFAEDPIAVSGDALLDLPVALTVVDGRVVHQAQ
jgi:predicted amidohydrolase YtcJ